jgi:hypothetical protein
VLNSTVAPYTPFSSQAMSRSSSWSGSFKTIKIKYINLPPHFANFEVLRNAGLLATRPVLAVFSGRRGFAGWEASQAWSITPSQPPQKILPS